MERFYFTSMFASTIEPRITRMGADNSCEFIRVHPRDPRFIGFIRRG